MSERVVLREVGLFGILTTDVTREARTMLPTLLLELGGDISDLGLLVGFIEVSLRATSVYKCERALEVLPLHCETILSNTSSLISSFSLKCGDKN